MKALQSNQGKKQAAFLLIVLLTTFGVIGLQLSQGIQEIENRSWDWRLKLSSRYSLPDSRIKIILVDQTSLDVGEKEGYTWPWPRTLYVPVIEFLKLAGAKGLAFDLLFTEASSHGASEDKELAQAIGGGLPVVSIASLSKSDRETDPEKFEIFRLRQNENNQKTGFAKRYLSGPGTAVFNSITMPVKEILEASAAFGNVTAEPDSDGIFRHFTPGGFVQGVPILNSPFAFYDLVSDENREFTIEPFLDQEGHLPIKFHNPEGAYSPVSIKAVIDSYLDIQEGRKPRLKPEEYKDSYVFLGVGAPGLFDFRPTPLNERAKGLEIIATVLDNILNNNFIKKISFWPGLFFAFLMIVLMSYSAFFIASLTKQILLISAGILLLVGIPVICAFYGCWLVFIAPFIGTISALLLSFAFQFQLEGRQHRFIKDAFRFYVSPSVIDKIISDPSTLSLGGEKRELTIFFSDIAGFTSISESIEANKLVPLINTFLTEMTAIIQKAGGTVDKYVGDAIVAFWNAPILIEDHATKAVEAALECQRRLLEMQDFFLKEYGVPIKMRIGIHTGVVSVGNFGSKERFNYTVVGDAANLASRLEGANKYFGTYTLISEDTQKRLGANIPSRKLAEIKVVGKSEIIRVFEPLSPQAKLPLENIKIFSEALSLYETSHIEEALVKFRTISKDPVARVYISKLEMELKNEDRTSWTHVWNLREK